jgi:uncharacterized membrane protein YgcG
MNAITQVRTTPLPELRQSYAQNNINSSLPNEDWNALTYFVAENDLESLTKLILSGAKTDSAGTGMTLSGSGHSPLHVAARFGAVDCMEHLIRGRMRFARKEFGDPSTDVIPSNEFGSTNNVFGSTHNETGVGCDVNARDRFGFTPLHYAAFSGFLDAVDTLLRLGAQVSVKAGSQSGALTPSEIAKRRGHLDVVDLLQRWERKDEDPETVKFREWLTALDCEAYSQAFSDAGYDMKFIMEQGLTDQDLDCVNVPRTKLGLRRKLLQKWRIEEFAEGGDDSGSDDDESGSGSDSGSDSESGSGSDSGSGRSGSGSGSDDDDSDDE